MDTIKFSCADIKKMRLQTITSEQMEELKKSKHVEGVKFNCVPTHLPAYEKFTVTVKGWGDMSVYMKQNKQ